MIVVQRAFRTLGASFSFYIASFIRRLLGQRFYVMETVWPWASSSMVREWPRPTTDTLSLLSFSVLHCMFTKATSVLVLAFNFVLFGLWKS